MDKRSTLSLLLLVFLLSPAGAEKFALVIGNSKYQKPDTLNSPANDAIDIAEVLNGFGFEVTTVTDANKAEMEKAISSFTKKVRPGDAALFYFSGHGVRSENVNYLIPLEAEIQVAAEYPAKAVSAQGVLEKLDLAKSRVSIIILDACRQIQDRAPTLSRNKSDSGGLAQMKASRGTLIAYATAPGKTASDGLGRNSVFTEHLLREMKDPKLPIEDVFKRTRTKVHEATNNRQTPWENSSLEGADFCLSDPCIRPVSPIGPPAPVDMNPDVNTIGMELRVIPPGKVLDEQQRLIVSPQVFLMSAHEVTQEQYEKVMREEGAPRPSRHIGPTRPVDSVSQKEAMKFCQLLSTMEGHKYRLPTKAEWEYACRAGTNTRYYCGDHLDPDYAWFDENSKGETHPVGQKQPNAFGLFDMIGNVWEWTMDLNLENAAKSMVCGGSWYDDDEDCQSVSHRDYPPISTRYKSVGFRVIRVLR